MKKKRYGLILIALLLIPGLSFNAYRICEAIITGCVTPISSRYVSVNTIHCYSNQATNYMITLSGFVLANVLLLVIFWLLYKEYRKTEKNTKAGGNLPPS